MPPELLSAKARPLYHGQMFERSENRMLHVVQRMAGLTNHRQRELLDVALAEALMDAVAPEKIEFFTLVAKGKERRWLVRGQFFVDAPPKLQDIMWAQFDSMELLAHNPERTQAYETATAQHLVRAGKTCTVFPIRGEQGVESLLEITTQDPLSPVEMQVVQSMQNVFLNMNALLDYSERDGLTGLLNRKSFEDAFFKALAGVPLHGKEATAYQQHRAHAELPSTYWIAMLDIDHFKKVNDQYGHLIGDEILLLVAQQLTQNFRFHDRIYRFGGEEFVVLMRCANLTDATNAAERFRLRMQGFSFPKVGHLTVSIGLTQLLNVDTPLSALERADAGVYRAKNRGRNQLVVETPAQTASIHSGEIELF